MLELNPSHTLVHSIYHIKDAAPDVAQLIVEQMLDNAKMTARLIDEPRTMVARLNQLLQVPLNAMNQQFLIVCILFS